MNVFAVFVHLLKKAWASFYESRNGPHWRVVRKLALIRDGFKCRKCKSKKNLHVHHLNGWAWFRELRFILSNLITLCSICHGEYHKWNGGTRVKCIEKTFWIWFKLKKKRKKKSKGGIVLALTITAAVVVAVFKFI